MTEFPMGQDTLEFCLAFYNADGLRISGWSHEPPTSFVLSELETGVHLVSVSGPGARLEFTAIRSRFSRFESSSSGPSNRPPEPHGQISGSLLRSRAVR